MNEGLYSEILTYDAAVVLQDLVYNASFIRNYVFVGGSALSIYLKHRKSEDLDFFTWDNSLYNKTLIYEYIGKLKDAEILNESEQGIDIRVKKTKITFFNAGWNFLMPKNIANFNIATLEALVAMKVHTLFLRAKYRDYYDLYFLAKEMQMKDMFENAKKIIPGITLKLFCMAIVYVDDILDDSIVHLSPLEQVTKHQIRDFFQQKIIAEGLLPA